MRSSLNVRFLVGLAAALSLILLSGCSRQQFNDGPRSDSASPPVSSSPGPAGGLNSVQLGGVDGYMGSDACRSCHKDQFESWHQSFHRTMTQFPNTNSVQADFHNVVLTNDGVRFSLSRKTNEFWVRMEPVTRTPEQAAAAPLDVPIGLITGSHHMQVFWVPSGEGNTQIGFPFTWLIPERRWVPRNSTFVRPPDAVHRSEIWNVVCSRCHATGIQPRIDSLTRTVSTRAAELGISCEACHGPGQTHTNARLVDRDKGVQPDDAVIRKEIVHPENIEPARSAQICGFCHSMKWIDQSEPWRQYGFRYRPGDDLERTTPIIRPSRAASIPGLADFLARNPDLLNDYFWPDGMVRVSGREYNGLIESPCFVSQKFSCISCHSMHKSEPDDQLARNRSDNRACTQCHEPFRDETFLITHTHHSAQSSGSQCYNCHMPHTTYGVLKAIRSHQISSPRVADELASGRPNACNLCHVDKTLQWTANRLSEWYQHPKAELAENSNGTAHMVRLALSGDAGQRALAAWHLSWPAALQISGTNWIAPVLSQLLDDPYAAVRCVAERSLRAISTTVPPEYDFTRDPVSRSPAREAVWNAWKSELQGSSPVFKPEVLVQADDLGALRSAFERWLNQRNDRPVRLRE